MKLSRDNGLQTINFLSQESPLTLVLLLLHLSFVLDQADGENGCEQDTAVVRPHCKRCKSGG